MKRRKQFEALFVITLFLLLIAYWEKSVYYAGVAILITITGLVWKNFSIILERIWRKLGEGIGLVNNKIILTIVFFLLLTPMSFLAKCFRRTTIKLKENKSSGFRERNHLYTKEDFENTW